MNIKKYLIHFLWIIWIALLVSLGVMYFGPLILRYKIFIYFVAPMSVIYGILSFSITPKDQLDVKLRFFWLVAIMMLFFYGAMVTKLDYNSLLIFKIFYSCWFLFFSILATLLGIYYKKNEFTILSNYQPSFGFNKSRNKNKGWISAYFWTGFISFIVFSMILLFRSKTYP